MEKIMKEENRKYKIVAIDDEIGPRESLRILLKKDYDILCTDRATEGIEYIKTEQQDLVVLDIRMPEMGGLEVLRRIREIDPHVSVVMLTGFGTLETAQQALRFGANDYVKKPFDAHEMREIVRVNIQRTQLARRGGNAVVELQKLNGQLVQEISKKERLASLGQASAEFVHDLNTPLGVISGYTQLIVRKLKGAEHMPKEELVEFLDFLTSIEKNVKRCCELTEVWRNLGVKDPRRFKPLSLNEMLSEVSEDLNSTSSAPIIELDTSSSWNEFKVKGDRLQLMRVFQNILSNALHAVPTSGGKIRVNCVQDGANVLIEVEDNGCGISTENLSRIFDPYFTTKEQNGTGLGLFITKKVLEDHGGSIHVTSELNKGTQVCISIPLEKVRVILWQPHKKAVLV
jgi:signal transduction histidine kinase